VTHLDSAHAVNVGVHFQSGAHRVAVKVMLYANLQNNAVEDMSRH